MDHSLCVSEWTQKQGTRGSAVDQSIQKSLAAKLRWQYLYCVGCRISNNKRDKAFIKFLGCL